MRVTAIPQPSLSTNLISTRRSLILNNGAYFDNDIIETNFLIKDKNILEKFDKRENRTDKKI